MVLHIELIITLLACVPGLLGMIIHLKLYIKTRYKAALLWFLIMFATVCLYLFIALSMIFLKREFMILGILFFIPIGFLIVIVLDILSKDHVNVIKISIISFSQWHCLYLLSIQQQHTLRKMCLVLL